MESGESGGGVVRKWSERERIFSAAVGAQVAVWRNARDLSQATLADRLGINAVTLSCYECGRIAIPLYLLLRCAAVLQVSFADLVGPATKKVADYGNEVLT